MKKLVYILSAALCGLALLPSCRKADVVETPTFVLCTDGQDDNLIVYGEVKNHTEELQYFEYASKAVAADSIYKAQRFHIYSNCDWKIVPISDDQDWVTPFPEDGGSGEGLIFFRVKRNNDRTSDRVAGYRFVLNDGMKDIEVGGTFLLHQANSKPRLETNVNKVEVVSTGGNASVKVSSNVAWTYTLVANADYASEDPALWTEDLTELKYEDEEKTVLSVVNTIKIKCPDNSNGSIRGFNIIIKTMEESLGIKDIVIPVTQEGASADIEGFPVQWKASAGNDYYKKWLSASNPIPTIDAETGSGTICFYRAEVPGLDRTASTCDASGSNPRVNGAWPGDYYEFTADAPVPAGSLIKIQYEARISGSGCRHWRLEYLDGSEWKIAGTLQTLVAPDGTEVRYTQDMYPGGSADDYNKIISQVVKYENTTSEVKFRWYVASNIISSDGKQMEKPTTASARLDFSGAATGTEPIISCVAAGGETLVYGNVTCSEELLLFEGTPEGPNSFTVTSDQDYTITTNSDWITLDVTSGAAYSESVVNVTCAPSTLSTLREGLITIVSGMTKKGIRVIQSAAGQELKPFISVVGGNYVNIDATTLSFNVTVQHNVDYEIVIPDTVDWISVEPIETKSLVDETLLVLYTAANVETVERSATISLVNKDEELLVPIVVTQGPASPSGESVISWTFSKDVMSSYKDAFEKTNSFPSAKGTGYISWVDLAENVALDVNSKKARTIGSTGEPFIAGAWTGDYWEFTVPGVTASAGSTVNFTGVTRCSATGQRYWAMMYNVGGEDWKYVKETQTETETGTNAVYTHVMTISNQTISETFKLEDAINNQTVRIRFVCVANWQCNGSGALAAPNGGTHRWSVPESSTDGPVITIKEPEPVLRAKWLFDNDTSKDAYVETFGTLSGTFKNTAGDNGMYVDTNAPSVGSGRITFVQVDKTSFAGTDNPKYNVGSTGHPFVTGVWPGDYWLFTATDGKEYPAGTKLHVKFLTRVSGTGQKFWTLEYWDGESWQPTDELQTETETGNSVQYNFVEQTVNVTVDKTFTLSKACTQMQFRMVCVANWTAGKKTLEAPNGGTCRLASDTADLDGTSPVFEVVE
ncbi:MAG: BACON domain-containing protein [Candidatus Cryptobacteroides sp.]